MSRELDAKIARLAFGADVIQCPRNGIWGYRCAGTVDTIDTKSIPAYSTDVAAAMTVFEKLVERLGEGAISLSMESARGQGHIYFVAVGMDVVSMGEGPLPLAICEAALAALTTPTAPR